MRLILEEVSVRFGSRVVLDRVSAQFDSGESVAIMGPSGVGKSTLLGVIAGVVELDGGAVRGSTADTRPTEWLVQSTPLLQRRRVVENVQLSALLRGVEEGDAMQRALDALGQVGIASLADHRTYTLSGGEKQRVAIARAMAARAPLILADEPTASLDPEMRGRICDALVAAARGGAIVIVATHDDFVSGRCDRTLVLGAGPHIESRP